MDELVHDFVVEARESLEALDTDLVAFERDQSDPELLGRIFRMVHTVKGTCGFIGLMRLQGVAHAAENVLGGFRDGSVTVSGEAVSAVLESVDAIRGIVEALERTGQEPEGDDTALIARLDRACVGGSAEPEAAPGASPEAPAASNKPLIDRLGGDATVDAACEGLHAALGREAAYAEAMAAADFDLFQGGVRDALCDTARGMAMPGALARALDDHGVAAAHDQVQAWLRKSLASLEAEPAAIEILLQQTAPAPSETDAAEPARSSAQAPVEALAGEAAAQAPAAAPAPTPAPAVPAAPEGAADPGAQTIRVGVDALEHLMTVASELVLIRNQLVQLLREQPESPFAAPLHRLNQVTTELQESVMTTRMQPISGAWAKLPRVVRDLARDLGKEIELVTQGQETELDRQVLELIKDPLTHMIRNAADHGLETPAERAAAGKSPVGKITLQARHEGGAILIEVGDDGRGLSAAKIRAKAVSQGLASEAAVEAMSDAEVRQFIFAAGFSTAAQVTAVSGRGVGMDVVRSNIEKIGGTVELQSVEGQGTRFTIRIPLTLTIVSALIVECGGLRFAMPQSSVVELVGTRGASGRDIEYVGGAAVLRLRDRLLPLVSLQSMLGLPEAETRRDSCIIVAKVGAFAFGIIVDRVFDTEEIVVKPVSQILRHLKVYSGATILGDGSVIMILDFKGMAAETGALGNGAGMEEEPLAAAEPTTPLLVFRAADGTLKAAPLGEVDRIEEVTADQLESVEDRAVMQYRSRLMPVVTSASGAPARTVDGRRPMLVFSRDSRSVGLLVNEIVDIVEATPTTDLRPAGEGSLGSLIVAGAATELIDVAACLKLLEAAGGTAPVRPRIEGPIPQASVEAGRRLLIVDRSPFCELMLKPILSKAHYEVVVAADVQAALALHDAGESFDLVLADASLTGDDARLFAHSFSQAERWHDVPLLGLHRASEEGRAFDGRPLLEALSTALQPSKAA